MAEQRVEAVERALALLDCFDGGAEALALADLAAKTGLYKSTILRLAASLERFGYLCRDGDGRFRIGSSLWRLGSLYRRDVDPAELIRPELQRLVEASGETASYYVREGDRRVCLYRRNSPHAARHHLTEGTRLPLAGGASARVLSARGTGGAVVSLGERDPEVAAVAVPVFDTAGGFRGALAISGLIGRFGEAAREAARAALEESAARLGRRLPPAGAPSRGRIESE